MKRSLKKKKQIKKNVGNNCQSNETYIWSELLTAALGENFQEGISCGDT